MKRILLPIFILGLASSAYSQVGINTVTPKATLDIAASPLSDNKSEGILIPKLSGDDLRAKNDLYNEDQNGTLLYVTSADTQPLGKTSHVTSVGFYSYDHSLQKWIKLGAGQMANSNVWMTQRVEETDVQVPASTADENISHLGQLAIGFDGITKYELDIPGGVPKEVKHKSFYDLDVRGNYQIRKEMLGATGNTEWYTDALLSLEDYSDVLNNQKIASRGKPDGFLKSTQLYSSLFKGPIANRSSTDKSFVKLKSWGYYPSSFIPFFALIFPDVALKARRNFSANYETGNTNFSRFFDFSDNVKNSTAFGYLEGRINLQTIKIPDEGQYTGDGGLSMSRIFIESPRNNSNYIELTSNSIVDETTKNVESSQVLVKHDGVNFNFRNYGEGVMPRGGSYTFPRTVGTNGQVLALENVREFPDYNDATANLVWKDPIGGGNNWRIQNTTNPATANTENIYQKGNVAIGFNEDDEVSHRTLEVKGDVKLQSQISPSQYNGFENNFSEVGAPYIVFSNLGNVMYTTNDPTFSLPDSKMSYVSSDKDEVRLGSSNLLKSYTNNLDSILELSTSSDHPSFYLRTRKDSEDYDSDYDIKIEGRGGELSLSTMIGRNMGNVKDSEIKMFGNEVQFVFNRGAWKYTFPSEVGEVGQVLAVDDLYTYATTRRTTLKWKDIGDLVVSGALKDKIRSYPSDSHADSDNTLPSGALYKLDGSRAVYQKP